MNTPTMPIPNQNQHNYRKVILPNEKGRITVNVPEETIFDITFAAKTPRDDKIITGGEWTHKCPPGRSIMEVDLMITHHSEWSSRVIRMIRWSGSTKRGLKEINERFLAGSGCEARFIDSESGDMDLVCLEVRVIGTKSVLGYTWPGHVIMLEADANGRVPKETILGIETPRGIRFDTYEHFVKEYPEYCTKDEMEMVRVN